MDLWDLPRTGKHLVRMDINNWSLDRSREIYLPELEKISKRAIQLSIETAPKRSLPRQLHHHGQHHPLIRAPRRGPPALQVQVPIASPGPSIAVIDRRQHRPVLIAPQRRAAMHPRVLPHLLQQARHPWWIRLQQTRSLATRSQIVVQHSSRNQRLQSAAGLEPEHRAGPCDVRNHWWD